MKLITLALAFSSILSFRSVFSPLPTPTPTPQTPLFPPVDISIFNSPTPTPVPTFTPTPSPTPSPTPIPPTSTPVPTPIRASQSDLDRWFEQYSREYHIDRMQLFSLAACESMLRTNAVNGPYAGLYQFASSSWSSTRITMGRDPDPSLRFNPEESIRTAAYKISVSGYGSWPACSKKIQ